MLKKSQIQQNCGFCQKEYISERRHHHKYCSPICYWKDKKGKPSVLKGRQRLQPAWNKGTAEIFKKICLVCQIEFETTASGKNQKYCSHECYVKTIFGNTRSLGVKKSEATIAKLRAIPKEQRYNYIKDRTQLKKYDDKRSSADVEFVREVLKRDNRQCRISNKDCAGQIETHHILSWKEYPELRYDTNNGITVCHFHHPRGKKEKEMVSYFQELLTNTNKNE